MTSNLQNRRLTVASLLLLAMLLAGLGHALFPAIPVWWAGIGGWGAMLILLTVSGWQRYRQLFVLSGLGALFLVWGWWRGGEISPARILAQNILLLTMLYGVSFLRLVAALGQEPDAPLPQGRLAFLKSMLGIHVLGAVINISVVILAIERLHEKGALDNTGIKVISRAFASAAFWSPFFAAMGVALTYSPGASLYTLLPVGALLALCALLVTVLQTGGWRMQHLREFRGYPMNLASLRIPLVLAIAVLLLHEALPSVPVVMVVAVTSILLTLSGLLLSQQKRGASLNLFRGHALQAASRMSNELSLFLGAGVLTVGLQVFVATFDDLLLFEQFGWWQAGLLLAASFVTSMLGIHPLVSAGVAAAFALPAQPEPDLLAMLCLAMWGLGVVINPLSGLSLTLRSYTGLTLRGLLSEHFLYTLVMWAIFTGLMFMVFG
ncbi:MAG: hypothetical protein R3F02_04505 [Thiolinea sp.]